MSAEVIEDLFETIEDIIAAVAAKEVDPADIVGFIAAALKIVSHIPLRRSPSGLRGAAERHAAKAVRLRRRGHTNAAARHDRRAREMLTKADEG